MTNGIDSSRHTTRARRRSKRTLGYTVLGAGVIAITACEGSLDVELGDDGGTANDAGANTAGAAFGGHASPGGSTGKAGGTSNGEGGTTSAGTTGNEGGTTSAGTTGNEGGTTEIGGTGSGGEISPIGGEGGSSPLPPYCDDHTLNGDETDVDCGGSCEACALPTCDCADSESLTFVACGLGIGLPFASADGQAVAFELCSEFACNPYYYTPLHGTLPVPGPAGGSSIAGMSEDGNLVLLRPYRERTKPVLYDVSDGSSTPLAINSEKLLMSGNGTVFGFATRVVGTSKLTRIVGGVAETLGEIESAVNELSIDAATPDGSVVVGNIINDSRATPFRWSEPAGLVIGLPDLPEATPNATLLNVSRDGSTFSGYLYAGNVSKTAFLWTEAGGVTELGASRASARRPLLSDDGSVVVPTLDITSRETAAFRWTASGGSVPLLPTSPSFARVMNPTGSVIFGGLDVPHTEEPVPFLWKPEEGARDLNDLVTAGGADLTDARLSTALTLSRDSTIAVGEATCGRQAALYRLEVPE